MSRMAKVARIERELEKFFNGATARQHGDLVLGTASLKGGGSDRIKITSDSEFKIVNISSLASTLEGLLQDLR